MNLYGLFDNLAWAFVLHHNLLSQVGDRKHGEYLKNFRDAFAHRVAPYIPPATYSRDDESEYIALEQQWLESIKAGELDRAKDISQQMMADAKTAAEVCSLFFVNWQQRAY